MFLGPDYGNTRTAIYSPPTASIEWLLEAYSWRDWQHKPWLIALVCFGGIIRNFEEKKKFPKLCSKLPEEEDFKNLPLPLARIKKIMKADEDVRVSNFKKKVILLYFNHFSPLFII